MHIHINELRSIIRSEVRRLTEASGPGPSASVPSDKDELRRMLIAACPPNGDKAKLQRVDLDSLWRDVKLELQDGTPWEEILSFYIHDALMKWGFDDETRDAILNHI